MIAQDFLDWLRDVILNWVSGTKDIIDTAGFETAGDAVASAGIGAGHFLALFIGAASWAVAVTAFGTYVGVWLVTGLIAVVSRRGTAS